jgi:hypothetical protein
MAPQGKLMEVTLTTKGSAVQAGIPRELFQASSIADYEPTPDGKRFLVIAPQENAPTPLTLVTNWTRDLKK